jgi:hypothetical protein
VRNRGPGRICRVPLPALEKPLQDVRRKVNAFRALIESELVEATGQVTPWQAKRIRSVCTALREYARCSRRMRKAEEADGTPLTHEQWLAHSKHLLLCEEKADKALDSLGLDKARSLDPWDAVFPARGLPAVPLPVQAPAQASDGSTPTEAAPIDSEASQGPSQAIPPTKGDTSP